MADLIEKEYKILINKEQYDLFKESYDFPIVIDQTNQYFDTPEGFVRSLNGSCRIRTIGDRKIFTLKIRINQDSLYEFEKEIDFKGFNQLKDQEIIGWFGRYHIPYRDLINTYQIHTIRHLLPLENAELCLDHTYFGPFDDFEIEYEYKKAHNGLQEFNKLLVPLGIKYEKNCPSKLARAASYALNL